MGKLWSTHALITWTRIRKQKIKLNQNSTHSTFCTSKILQLPSSNPAYSTLENLLSKIQWIIRAYLGFRAAFLHAPTNVKSSPTIEISSGDRNCIDAFGMMAFLNITYIFFSYDFTRCEANIGALRTSLG